MVTGETGGLEAVDQWVNNRNLKTDGPIDSLNDEFEYLTWVRLLIAQNKPTLALQLLARLLQAAKAGGRTARVIEIWLLQALALQSLGDINQALTTIEQALLRAEPEGYVHLFVDVGKPIEKLLRRATSRGIMPKYANRLLAILRAGKRESDQFPQPPNSVAPLVTDSLSERELDVLRLLRTDLTGPEIATELSVSVNTVKTHIKNIYSKLDAHSRYEAVERAKQLDLL